MKAKAHSHSLPSSSGRGTPPLPPRRPCNVPSPPRSAKLPIAGDTVYEEYCHSLRLTIMHNMIICICVHVVGTSVLVGKTR